MASSSRTLHSSSCNYWSRMSKMANPEVIFSNEWQNRKRRRRCTFSKYFTKTGMFLVMGVIILLALPPWAFCRPVEQENAPKQIQVYVHSSDGSSAMDRLASPLKADTRFNPRNDDDIVADAVAENGRFEFQRKISSSSAKEPVRHNNFYKDNATSKTVHTIEISSSNDKVAHDDLLAGNSSMIVHVIVSSSSSTSSGSVELDETENISEKDSSSIPEEEETIQYTISEGDDNASLAAEPSSESHVSSAKTAVRKREYFGNNASNPDKHVPQSSFSYTQTFHDAPGSAELDLKRLPKSDNDSDIFSAFYRAFAETSFPSGTPFPTQTTTTPAQKTTSIPVTTSTSTVASPPRSDFRQRPSSFKLFQQRRRLYRNRQWEISRSSSTTPPAKITAKAITTTKRNASIEEAERKLEFLAKKIHKSEVEESFRGQTDKNAVVSSSSSSSLIKTTTQVPFLLSQPSITSVSSVSPAKIAVSVTHSKSVVATSSFPSAAAARRSEPESPKQEVKSSYAKSEATFSSSQAGRDEKIPGTYPFSSQPRPLIKSLPRNKDDHHQQQEEYDSINNNKNRGNNNIFPKNFSTHGSQQENDILRKIYEIDGVQGTERRSSNVAVVNGNARSRTAERNSNNSKYEKVKEDNLGIQDRLGVSSFSRDGNPRPSSSNPPTLFRLPGVDSSNLFETTSSRPSSPHRRKIARTVSSELGDPTALFFNVNVNYGPTSRSSSKVPVYRKPSHSPQQTSPKPTTTMNWQQPEKVWSEPAQVWGVPAKIWGEPERVWSEPAKIWSQPAQRMWRRTLEDEMMQADQPPAEDRDEESRPPHGTFVILGDDENEGDSIDGDLGRPLMLHHFTVPPNKQKETVSVSSSVTSSVSTNCKNAASPGCVNADAGSYSKVQVGSPQKSQANFRTAPADSTTTNNSELSSASDSSDEAEEDNTGNRQSKKSPKKFGYVIEGANVRKYRVEERTPDGFIVGEYGVLNNQNAFLRGVRYTADGTINPRLIHEALMKFLSLRR